MAAGDAKYFRDFILKNNRGDYAVGDTWTLAFISDQYSTVNADATNPVLADVTVVSGGNVAAAYNLASFTITRATTTITFDAADIGQILKDAGNPSPRCAVIYNNTSASDDLVQVYDLTTDGTTALDLVNNDFTFSFGAGGILTATVV